jgi:hypothetical protein
VTGLTDKGRERKVEALFGHREEKPPLRLWVALVRKNSGPGSVIGFWSHALGLTLRFLEARLLPEFLPASQGNINT